MSNKQIKYLDTVILPIDFVKQEVLKEYKLESSDLTNNQYAEVFAFLNDVKLKDKVKDTDTYVYFIQQDYERLPDITYVSPNIQ